MKTVAIAPFNMIGIAVRTSNQNGQAMADLGKLWGRFMNDQIQAAIPNKLNDSIYCVYTDYESDHTKPYTAILGCRVAHLDLIPDGMTGKSIIGGEYVELSAKGDLTTGIVGVKWGEI